MALLSKNITETRIIPRACREQFLSLAGSPAVPLTECGICFSGISELSPPYTIARRAPAFHLVIFTLGGRGRFELPHAEGELRTGDFWVVPAGTPQHYWAEADWRIAFFHLDVGSPGDAMIGDAPPVRSSEGLPALEGAMRGYLEERRSRLREADRAAQAWAELIRVHLEREMRAQPVPPERRTRIRLEQLWKEVELQLAWPWTVPELAQRFGLSAAQFRRLMLAQVGCTPAEMLRRLRLTRAQELLRRTDDSLEHIADQVGYDSPFSLSRAFRRFSGCSPRAYRRGSPGPSAAE